jgi:hypothetical protein
MRAFAQFRPSFWTGETGRKLRGNPGAQVLAAYLFTCSHANSAGLYYLPLAYASHETGLSLADVTSAMELLTAAGFAQYDAEAECVWVVNAAKEQTTRSPKAIAGTLREVRMCTSRRLQAALEQMYGSQLEALRSGTVSRALDTLSGEALLKETDSEQETESEQDAREARALAAAKPANDQRAPASQLTKSSQVATSARIQEFHDTLASELFELGVSKAAERAAELAKASGCTFEVATRKLTKAAHAEHKSSGKAYAFALVDCTVTIPKAVVRGYYPGAIDPERPWK